MIPAIRQARFMLTALALVAGAFFLRVYRLGDKNVWWDEGWTVWLSQHDFGWIALRTASDEHPPLHYWLMHVWQAALGTDAFTGRFFSLLFGVLLVALVYRLGKEMGGARLGLLAALFLALARFNVWWSQDIKNYTLSAFFAWASVLFVWKWVIARQTTDSRQQRLYWIGYILATFLALFSHYLAALIILANNVFVLIVLGVQWRRGENVVPRLLGWSLAQIAVLVLFAPWLYIYLQNGATWSAAPTFDFGLFLRLAATVLTLGVTTYIENYTWVVLGILLVAALSVGWIVRFKTTDTKQAGDRQRAISTSTMRDGAALSNGAGRSDYARATLYMLLVALIPPALIYVLSLTPAAIFAPKIQARYLVMLTPAIAMLVALGVLFVAENLRGRLVAQFATAALILMIVGAQSVTLNDYFGERVLRDEYATLSQMINNFGLNGDAIVLNTDQEYPTFLYYLKRPFDWVGVPNGTAVTETSAQHVVAGALQHNAVWVVTIPDALQQDPTRLVEQKIGARLAKQYEQTFGDKRLTLYSNALRNVKDAPGNTFSPQVLHDDVFDDHLKLVGVDVPVREAYSGDVVSVVTYWQAQDLTTINLSLQTVGGEIVARSAIPISIGAHERAQADLQIPPDSLASELRVVAQARLRSLAVGTLDVLPRRQVDVPASDSMLALPTYRFGKTRSDSHIQLVGLSQSVDHLRAGEPVRVGLFWRTDAPIATSYTVFVHLLGAQYNPSQNNTLWGQIDRLPLDGKLPTTAWSPNQLVADSFEVKLQDTAPAGTYQFEIGMYDAGGTRLHIFDAQDNDIGDALIRGKVTVP